MAFCLMIWSLSFLTLISDSLACRFVLSTLLFVDVLSTVLSCCLSVVFPILPVCVIVSIVCLSSCLVVVSICLAVVVLSSVVVSVVCLSLVVCLVVVVCPSSLSCLSVVLSSATVLTSVLPTMPIVLSLSVILSLSRLSDISLSCLSRSSAALSVAVLSFVCLVVVVAVCLPPDMSVVAKIHIAIAVPNGIVAPIKIPPIFTGIRLD